MGVTREDSVRVSHEHDNFRWIKTLKELEKLPFYRESIKKIVHDVVVGKI